MEAETVPKDVYKALVDLDEHLHNVLSLMNTKKDKKSLMSLAGTWKYDDDTYNTFCGVIKERRKLKLRKWPSA